MLAEESGTDGEVRAQGLKAVGTPVEMAAATAVRPGAAAISSAPQGGGTTQTSQSKVQPRSGSRL